MGADDRPLASLQGTTAESLSCFDPDLIDAELEGTESGSSTRRT